MKRPFDLAASTLGLLLLSPFFLLVAIAIKLDSRGPVFFRGERIGKDGKPFRIFKFRTMVVDAAERGGLTYRDDPRITRIGHFLRRTKLDELPQLLNVIRGEMSLVGPRPEAPKYIQYYSRQQREVLSLRPGITSIASIRYRNEAELLPPDNWEKAYIETVLPAKLDIELNYLDNRSLGQDLLIIAATVFALIKDEAHFDALANATVRVEEFVGRYLSWMSIDILTVVAAFVLAILVRSINTNLDFPQALLIALAGVLVYIASNYGFGIYRRFWRFASAGESIALFSAVTMATAVLTGIDLMLAERDLPLGAVWLGGFFTFCFMTAMRYRRQLLKGACRALENVLGFASGRGARVLIIGAGEEGQLLAWQLQNRLQGRVYEIVGFVDDNRRKHGLRIHNVPVLGDRKQIPELVAHLHVDLILLAIPPVKIRDPKGLLKLCRATFAQIKTSPSLFHWLEHNGRLTTWSNGAEDLLQRAAYMADGVAGQALLGNRVVMVTGAAGSIGQELCRQIAIHQPRRLLLLDVNESGLHDLKVELAAQHKQLSAEAILCDITNFRRLQHVFQTTQPQIVFHAAAYKHVPMLEQFPHEAVHVNLLGTRTLHALAQSAGVERFVLISSDKAVNPTNVLGMTKWLGELLVTQTPLSSLPHVGGTEGGRMLSTAVRFGNVLGSRGSVLPTFERQIELGGPITITHPDMTRYFLSISEAVSLVIQAAALTRGGDLFILDMGMPIRILDLAHRMIRAHGLRPGQDIAIEFVGQRPGEKMSEELVAHDEEKVATEHPSIFHIRRQRAMNDFLLHQHVDALISLSHHDAPAEALSDALRRAVAELQNLHMQRVSPEQSAPQSAAVRSGLAPVSLAPATDGSAIAYPVENTSNAQAQASTAA